MPKTLLLIYDWLQRFHPNLLSAIEGDLCNNTGGIAKTIFLIFKLIGRNDLVNRVRSACCNHIKENDN